MWNCSVSAGWYVHVCVLIQVPIIDVTNWLLQWICNSSNKLSVLNCLNKIINWYNYLHCTPWFKSSCVFCATEKPEDPFILGQEPLGFFPPPHRKRPSHLSVADDAHRLPPADGFIPNSVLIRLLFPEKTLIEEAAATYRPPRLTAAQIEYISQFKQTVQCLIFLILLLCFCHPIVSVKVLFSSCPSATFIHSFVHLSGQIMISHECREQFR